MPRVRALAATGMLGAGYSQDSLERGMARQPDFIGVDSGSTDSGPYYLGSGKSHFSDEAYRRDLLGVMRAARHAGIPLLIGSAGTAGGDVHVDRIAGIIRDIARTEGLSFKLALIYTEQNADYLLEKLKLGKIKPLHNAPTINEDVIRNSTRIVGMIGAEPFMEALNSGADVVLAGRASDTSIFAAIPTAREVNPGSVWHAAKILECGASCSERRTHPDSLFAEITDDYFTVEPPNPAFRCTPTSVASHNLYENPSPYKLYEPAGMLNTFNARYEAVSDRAVKVSGSELVPADQYTVKLEGAELAGYQSIALGTVRDPVIVGQVDSWVREMKKTIHSRFNAIYAPDVIERTDLQIRVIGKGATMGPLESSNEVGPELGVLIQVTADSQELAASLVKSASHIALHFPVPEWSGIITGLAYPYSPAEIDRGATYGFNMNHVVEIESPLEVCRIEYELL